MVMTGTSILTSLMIENCGYVLIKNGTSTHISVCTSSIINGNVTASSSPNDGDF